MIARGDKVKTAPTDMARYNDNIRPYLQPMNDRLPEPIPLPYYKYLTAFYRATN